MRTAGRGRRASCGRRDHRTVCARGGTTGAVGTRGLAVVTSALETAGRDLQRTRPALAPFRPALGAALPRALDHVLALCRRGALPALPQLLATLLGQLLKLVQILTRCLRSFRRQ